MLVTNNTYFTVIAIGHHTTLGYSEDVEIRPYETKQVNGPYIDGMEDTKCYVVIRGKLKCQSDPDDGYGFQIKAGKPINIMMKKNGIYIRHHQDPLDPQVLEWRASRCQA